MLDHAHQYDSITVLTVSPWAYLVLHTTLSPCRKLLGLSSGQKWTSSPMPFWRYCKLYKLILGNLGMPGYTHPKYQNKYAWICLNLSRYEQDSEYTSGPKYAKILNVTGFSICERCTAFWICQNMPWQSSKYILGYEYARILNMAGFWYMQELHRVLNMPQYGWICFNRM